MVMALQARTSTSFFASDLHASVTSARQTVIRAKSRMLMREVKPASLVGGISAHMWSRGPRAPVTTITLVTVDHGPDDDLLHTPPPKRTTIPCQFERANSQRVASLWLWRGQA